MQRSSSFVFRGALAGALVLGLQTPTVFAASLPANFAETTVASGLSAPSLLQIAPDGRVFVTEQGGRIRIVREGQPVVTFFTVPGVQSANERGLQGLAFDPNYAANRWVYFYYTRSSPHNNVIARVRASAANPDTAEAGSMQTLLVIPTNGSNIFHNGGGVQFGNDGKLYVSVGDHQSGSGESLNNLWGKVLRLDPALPAPHIPSDNPFFNTSTGNNRAIWAYGFRNPFTLDVQPGTGRIFVNDVGNSAGSCCEEVNLLERGDNYGWPPASDGAGAWFRYTASDEGGNAITGGDFYNPTTVNFPASFVGKYFFADYGGGWIRYINGSGTGPGSLTNFASGIGGPTDVEVHPDGSLYYVAHNGGQVRRVRSTIGPTPTATPTRTATPVVTPTPTPTPGVTPSPTPEAGEITPPASAVTASTSDGNLPGNTVDNNLATRWSGNGDGAWLRFDLGMPRRIGHVGIAVYQGNARRNSFDLQTSDNGTAWTTIFTGQTSGTTTVEETYDFDDVTARYIRYLGHGNTVNMFSSLTEVSIFANGPTPTPTRTPTSTPTPVVSPTPTPVVTPTPTPGTDGELRIGNATASTNDGNVPANAFDGNLGTRWSGMGDGAFITFDVGTDLRVSGVSIAVYNGTGRRNQFDIQLSNSETGGFTTVFSGQTSGTTLNEERFNFTSQFARYIRYVGHGAVLNAGGTSPWNSVTEFSVYGRSAFPRPTPTSTPVVTPTVPPRPTPTPTPVVTPTPTPGAGKVKWAGARSSNYGISPFPSAQGWTNAMTTMASYFPGATPTGVWLVGEIFFAGANSGQGLEFPNPGGSWDSRIRFQATDKHEPILDYFDTHGIKVFLQFEPGFAPIDQLFEVTYRRYGHHPSVIGFGVDVEWYHSSSDGGGNDPAGDAVVRAWNDKVKSLNPSYRLFVKHFDRGELPQTLRGDILFIDDSEQNGSYSGFLAEMKGFADFYNPAAVGYQFGYPSDRGWWSGLATPIPQTIGRALINQTRQNECGMFWVDFSLREVLPTN
jgi:glucose/arabinose dehydrogenase